MDLLRLTYHVEIDREIRPVCLQWLELLKVGQFLFLGRSEIRSDSLSIGISIPFHISLSLQSTGSKYGKIIQRNGFIMAII